MPNREPSDTYAQLHTAFQDAGWLVPMRLRQSAEGPQVWIEGLDMQTAEELALTIQAGIETRVIRR